MTRLCSPSVTSTRPSPQRDAGVGAGVGEAEDLGAQILAGELGGAAGDEGLARRRGLAAIEGEVGVGRGLADGLDRHAQRIRQDLRHDGGGALADILHAVVEADGAVAEQADALGRGVAHAGIAAAVPDAGDADAAADGARRRGRCAFSSLPARAQCLQALDQADAARAAGPRRWCRRGGARSCSRNSSGSMPSWRARSS